MQRRLLTIDESCGRLRCRRTKLYNLLRAQRLSGFKNGRRTFVDGDSVDAYLANLPPLQLTPLPTGGGDA